MTGNELWQWKVWQEKHFFQSRTSEGCQQMKLTTQRKTKQRKAAIKLRDKNHLMTNYFRGAHMTSFLRNRFFPNVNFPVCFCDRCLHHISCFSPFLVSFLFDYEVPNDESLSCSINKMKQRWRKKKYHLKFGRGILNRWSLCQQIMSCYRSGIFHLLHCTSIVIITRTTFFWLIFLLTLVHSNVWDQAVPSSGAGRDNWHIYPYCFSKVGKIYRGSAKPDEP